MITVDIDSIKQQRYIISPPQLRLKCAQERDYIYIYILYIGRDTVRRLRPLPMTSLASLASVVMPCAGPLPYKKME